jgi:hypothetical protein
MVASPFADALPVRGNLLKLSGLSINLNRFSAPFPTSIAVKGRNGEKTCPQAQISHPLTAQGLMLKIKR